MAGSPGSGELEQGRLKAEAFIRRSRAENTRRTYRSAFAAYDAWCRRMGYPAMSGDPETVCLYVASLPEQGLRLSTIRLKLSAIAAAHRAAGLSLDLKHPRIAQVMEGIARTLGSRPDPVTPVLAEDLSAMMRTMPATSPGIRDRALLLIGFGAALRRSELVALDLDHVTVTEQGLKLLIASSKGDQEGQGQEVGIHRSGDPSLCPVRAYGAWLDLRGRTPGPLFQQIVRGGAVRPSRLSDRGVARAVKAAALRAGLDPERYAGHSLRSGLATSASNAGADLLHIMNQTRHRSVDMVRRYVRDAEIWRNNVSRLVLPQAAASMDRRGLTQPDDLDVPLRRTLAFDRFEWLLREGRLFMAPIDEIEDATEAARDCFVSCWRLEGGDAAEPWRRYARASDAVAILTTYRSLRECLPAYIRLGVVGHGEVRAVAVRTDAATAPSFEANHFESSKVPGRFAHAPPLDLHRLVRAILLHPDADEDDATRLRALCDRHGLPRPERSKLRRAPVF